MMYGGGSTAGGLFGADALDAKESKEITSNAYQGMFDDEDEEPRESKKISSKQQGQPL